MTPEDFLSHLTSLGIASKTYDHPPVFTVAQAMEHWTDIPGVHCKNLFMKDAKGVYWLVVVPFEREINMKTLHTKIGAKRLSFAQPPRLMAVLKTEPGHVSPFALIHDPDHVANVVLDAWMMDQDLLNFHPLSNTKTTAITPADLRRFIDHCGHQPQTVDLA